jgi:hypothetical protein
MKTNVSTKAGDILNLIWRRDKYSENSIESSVQTQILEQQKQLHGRNYHIPLNTNADL